MLTAVSFVMFHAVSTALSPCYHTSHNQLTWILPFWPRPALNREIHRCKTEMGRFAPKRGHSDPLNHNFNTLWFKRLNIQWLSAIIQTFLMAHYSCHYWGQKVNVTHSPFLHIFVSFCLFVTIFALYERKCDGHFSNVFATFLYHFAIWLRILQPS